MRTWILAGGLMALLSPMAGYAGCGLAQTDVPNWDSLEYLQRAAWVTAVSKIELRAGQSGDPANSWQIQASNSIGDNREVVDIEARTDGSLISRERESVGRQRRRTKLWRYDSEGITRLRMEPGTDASEYTITSERRLSYPAQVSNVSDPLMLLPLATPTPGGAVPTSELIVQTDFNFYRVELSVVGRENLEVKYSIDGEQVAGVREVILVGLETAPIEPLADKPDFSLLGLAGNVVIAYDAETGIPLQLRGEGPWLGQIELNLVAATLRSERS
jgi:hypothetical protein